mmetsp:Transcript_16876/g.23291  ORF Transcript_16876/g.23291 Transcript_16876/m.23291 type:complete len:80 (-) Transcript_16876:357-596(-)
MLPVCDKIQDFKKELSTSITDEFRYLRYCMNETMRIEAPAKISAFSCFSQDTRIGDLLLKAEQTFVINIRGIMRDPRQW